MLPTCYGISFVLDDEIWEAFAFGSFLFSCMGRFAMIPLLLFLLHVSRLLLISCRIPCLSLPDLLTQLSYSIFCLDCRFLIPSTRQR